MSFPVKDPLTWQYPPIEPYNTGKLKVSALHEIYLEESGNPNGKPVVFLHGGPGGGSEPKQRRFFHPEKYRIVQGRYDVVCPLESAWELHRAWPEADFIITPDSGHSAFEPPNSRALVAATDRFASGFGNWGIRGQARRTTK